MTGNEKRLRRALRKTLTNLEGHHDMLECDWHVEPDGKEGDPCTGCDTIAFAKRTLKETA